IPVSTALHHAFPEGTTLEQLSTELLALMAQESLNHHRMGQIYNYIVENKLAENAGFKDARDYFTQKLADLSQSALSMYGAVAEVLQMAAVCMAQVPSGTEVKKEVPPAPQA